MGIEEIPETSPDIRRSHVPGRHGPGAFLDFGDRYPDGSGPGKGSHIRHEGVDGPDPVFISEEGDLNLSRGIGRVVTHRDGNL